MRPLAIAWVVVAAVAVAGVARAERAPGAVHVAALAGYGAYADFTGWIAGVLLDTSPTVSPLGPAGLVLWDRGQGELLLGARLHAYPGRSGGGVEAAIVTGAAIVRRPRFELFLLPGVGVASFHRETAFISLAGAASSAVLSLGLAGAVSAHDGLELVLFVSVDVLPSLRIATLPLGFDVVAGIGLGYRFPL